MLKVCIPILNLCFVFSVEAQGVYYPLHVGDRWQLVQLAWPTPPTYSFINLKLISDTTMPNGHTYVRFDVWLPVFQRQQGDQVLTYSIADGSEHVLYDFSRSIGDTVGIYADDGGFDVVLLDTAVLTLFGQPRRIWSFRHIARHLIDANTTQTIADSIGLISVDGFNGPYNFCGAVISGKTYGTIVGLPFENPSSPAIVQLYQNYPNPFNPNTIIRYQLPKSALVNLSVYDILGREVSVLVNERKKAGYHEVKFDGTGLSSGVYFYRLTAGSYVETRKLVLMR
jgi:hypothetical protein